MFLILPMRMKPDNGLALYMRWVYWEERGKSDMYVSEHSWQGIFHPPNFGHHGTGRDQYFHIISNLGIEDKPKRSDKNYGHPNWDVTLLVEYLNKHTETN